MMISNEIVKRTPLPVVYEQACEQLANVSTVLDAKYFADKAEALAAWAKIYRSDQAAVEAKRLKLHAYRKMGLIAEQLRPTKNKGTGSVPGRAKGAFSLLKENGLNTHSSYDALKMSRVSEKDFDLLISQKRPPGIKVASRSGVGGGLVTRPCGSPSYHKFFGGGCFNIYSFSMFIRKNDTVDTTEFSSSEIEKAETICRTITDWFDALDRKLQHRKSLLAKTKASKAKP